MKEKNGIIVALKLAVFSRNSFQTKVRTYSSEMMPVVRIVTL